MISVISGFDTDPRHDGLDGHCADGCPCLVNAEQVPMRSLPPTYRQPRLVQPMQSRYKALVWGIALAYSAAFWWGVARVAQVVYRLF